MVVRWKGGWRDKWKDEGIKKYKLVVTKWSQGCKVQVGNVVNNIIITMNSARWVLELWRDHLRSYTDV